LRDEDIEVLILIIIGDAEEDEQPLADLTRDDRLRAFLDDDARARDALDDGAHGSAPRRLQSSFPVVVLCFRLRRVRLSLASAWSRSATRSSASSMPTESRIRPSARPAARRTAGSIEPWVMDAGCSMRLSTPPSDSASEKSLVSVQSLFPSSTEPR